MASQPRDDDTTTGDLTASAGAAGDLDEMGESLDERGFGPDTTAANPVSPDAGMVSAEDAPAAATVGEPAEIAVARRRREEGDQGTGPAEA